MSGVQPRDLIREIKKRPGIFNRDVLERPGRKQKHQLWLEVAELLTPAEDWESYTEVEKEARMDEIAMKWKHMRANFYREVKLLESGEANKKRKYLYFDDMKFMRPYVGCRLPRVSKSNSDFEDDSDIDELFLKSSDDVVEEESKVEPNNSTVHGGRPKSSRVIKPTLKAIQNKSTSSSPTIATRSQKEAIIKNFNVLKKTGGSVNPSFKIRDGDISFCLSLVPTLRKLGDARKLRAKIEILKVLHRYVDHNERRNNAMRANNTNQKNIKKSADVDDDNVAEDNLEDYEEVVNVKREQNDPLNGGRGGVNTKTWWT